MTLDLLHEFANTEIFCLCHNCMWQSRHSKVNVYLLALCEQTDGLFTFNGSLRSYMICVYVFVCVFDLISAFNRHWHTTGKHVSLFFHWCFRSQVRHVFDFLSTRTGWLLCQNKSPCSNNWNFWRLVGFVGSLYHLQQLLKPILSSNCL